MNIEEIREICLAVHPAVTEDVPFAKMGYDDVAFRIAGKIFAFLPVDDCRMVTLKCAPDRAVELRERYSHVIEPAFHWNKKYWNQVHYDSTAITVPLMRELVQHAFDEVVKKLPRSVKAKIFGQGD